MNRNRKYRFFVLLSSNDNENLWQILNEKGRETAYINNPHNNDKLPIVMSPGNLTLRIYPDLC